MFVSPRLMFMKRKKSKQNNGTLIQMKTKIRIMKVGRASGTRRRRVINTAWGREDLSHDLNL